MLDGWLRALENERGGSLDRLAAVCKDKGGADLAAKEIELHYLSVRDWLVRIYESGYEVNDDLSRLDTDYDAFEDYRKLMNHVEHHLRRLRRVPVEVEEGRFEAVLANYY